MAFEYRDTPLLPASAPLDHPHVGDFNATVYEDFQIGGPRLCDGIATLIHHCEEKHPNSLKDFLNPDTKSFKLLFEPDDDCMMSFFLMKKDNKVFTGVFNRYEDLLEWDLPTTSTISETGAWTTVQAASRAYTGINHEDAFDGKFLAVNSQSSNANDPERCLKLGTMVSIGILQMKYWTETGGKITITKE